MADQQQHGVWIEEVNNGMRSDDAAEARWRDGQMSSHGMRMQRNVQSREVHHHSTYITRPVLVLPESSISPTCTGLKQYI